MEHVGLSSHQRSGNKMKLALTCRQIGTGVDGRAEESGLHVSHIVAECLWASFRGIHLLVLICKMRVRGVVTSKTCLRTKWGNSD